MQSTSSSDSTDDFAYEEPHTAPLLILASYLWILNLSRWVFQYLVGAGLLGEILMGMIWGSPLAGWLQIEWQSTFVVLGYIGLLLIVFEGELIIQLFYL
jgi:Kef-type K+ transport system membrane component KefB